MFMCCVERTVAPGELSLHSLDSHVFAVGALSNASDAVSAQVQQHQSVQERSVCGPLPGGK